MFPLVPCRSWSIFGSPRVCGDVSAKLQPKSVQAKFSPRMRGCFYPKEANEQTSTVLPAYAGMFLQACRARCTKTSSPRVCGDVSQPSRHLISLSWFSPRMRGCFSQVNFRVGTVLVLPAYAGMFPGPIGKRGGRYRSPRVCGDVSKSTTNRASKVGFSPRMRGCFFGNKRPNGLIYVLPAYAGMFHSAGKDAQGTYSSPRVCGDVSPQGFCQGAVPLFSPRMRGCFWDAEAPVPMGLVLPAYAGLFLFLKAWRQNYSGYSRAKKIIRHHAVYSACSLVILTICTVISQFIYTIQMVVYENKI